MGDRDKRPSGTATRDKELRNIKDATRTGKSKKKENRRPEGSEPKQRKKIQGSLGTNIFRRRF